MPKPSFHERMRAKPKHIRARWAFWSAFLITGVLGLAWLAYIPGKLERYSQKNAEELAGIEEPVGNFGRVMDNVQANIQIAFQQLQATFSSTSANVASSSEATEVTATSTATSSNPNEIDFSTFFDDIPEEYEDYELEDEDVVESGATASSGSSAASTTPATPRRVLIGTSSRETTE